MVDQQDQADQTAYVRPRSTDNKIADAGFICGFLGLLSVWVPFVGLILSALGVILGAIGIGEACRYLGNGKYMGLAGVVLGATSIIMFIALVRTAG